MTARFGLGAIALVASLGFSPLAAAPVLEHGKVVLQSLDKVTARVGVIEVPIGEEKIFGTLSITPRACLETPPTEPPESAAFLEIHDIEQEHVEASFTGWMFASSPALSALEHPVYDVWVIDCAEPLFSEVPAPRLGEDDLPEPGEVELYRPDDGDAPGSDAAEASSSPDGRDITDAIPVGPSARD